MSPTRAPIPAGTLIRVSKCMSGSDNTGVELLEGREGWALIDGQAMSHPRYTLEWIYPGDIGHGVNEHDVYEVPKDEDVPDWVWAAIAKKKLSE